ncbi:hypothetical protein [Rhodobacter sp. NSM]|uniref:hypothetical protein n=1 Tax=Rhodobacter sp. NSM TaxID=3457501 RepID=UPI003FCFBED9
MKEIRRGAYELDNGKGRNEKPFVGRDEHEDPLTVGYETAQLVEEFLDERQGRGPTGRVDRHRSFPRQEDEIAAQGRSGLER